MWYQHLSLPWPITDRHWVIEAVQDVDLAAGTESFVWAHRWDLIDGGPARARRAVAAGRAGDLTPGDIEGAIYLPANEGAWILFSLDHDLTLLAYRVRTVVGGGIPDSWITTFAMAQLEGLLRQVEDRAPTARADYDADRTPIHDGLGELIRVSDEGSLRVRGSVKLSRDPWARSAAWCRCRRRCDHHSRRMARRGHTRRPLARSMAPKR